MTKTYPNKAATAAAAACADSAAGLAKGFRSMAVCPPGSHDAYSPPLAKRLGRPLCPIPNQQACSNPLSACSVRSRHHALSGPAALHLPGARLEPSLA